jgi:DNA-binding MarR family transcriptional regulator
MMELPCACAAARQVSRLLTQMYDSKLRASGIEAPQFALLVALEQAGACTQAKLGRMFAMDKTTMSRNLKVLERNGWVETAVGADRRQRELRLTASGRERLAAAKPEWKRAQDQLRTGMSQEEWDEMFRIFRKVSDAVGKEMNP